MYVGCYYFQPTSGWTQISVWYGKMILNSMDSSPELFEGHKVAFIDAPTTNFIIWKA